MFVQLYSVQWRFKRSNATVKIYHLNGYTYLPDFYLLDITKQKHSGSNFSEGLPGIKELYRQNFTPNYLKPKHYGN